MKLLFFLLSLEDVVTSYILFNSSILVFLLSLKDVVTGGMTFERGYKIRTQSLI